MEIRLRGRAQSFTLLDDAVALRGDQAAAARSAQETLRVAGARAAADARDGGRFGIRLPAEGRDIFERAGWVFAEANASLNRHAAARSAIDGVRAWPVVVDRHSTSLILTDLVTAKLHDPLSPPEVEAALAKAGLTLVRRLRFARNLVQAQMSGKAPLAEQLASLQAEHANDGFEFIEPAFLQAFSTRATGPGVPTAHPAQWQHHNTGQAGGTAGADGRTAQAWAVAQGRGVRLAFIDNGFHLQHPHLQPALYRGGHFSDDGLGSGPFVPRGTRGAAYPVDDHGTFCLGMAGARPTGASTVCGAAPACDLVPIACLVDQVGTQATLARAVAYAADPSTENQAERREDGAHVIACSLGPSGSGAWTLTSALDLALQFASTQARGGKGTPIFWAVSNAAVPIADDEVCSHPQVIAVGRSNHHDQSDGSAFGPKLAFLAPGAEVYSTYGQSSHRVWTGTSFACPFTAGVAALVLERFPQLTGDEVAVRLSSTCDKVGGVAYDAFGHHDEYGSGRINALQAVT